MAVREITINPSGQKGYAVFMENPKDRTPLVRAFTDDYTKYILVRQNAAIATQFGISYSPPPDGNNILIPQWLHSTYLAQNWIDRTPHMVELVDEFYDFKINETDKQKAFVTVPKRYNIMFGSLLDPPYPELLPAFRVPLIASPI